MPEISRFYGIVIGMFYKDHAPPHFHAFFAGSKASVNIETGEFSGTLPRRVKSLVLEWLALHRAELLDDWALARNARPLKRIQPLE